MRPLPSPRRWRRQARGAARWAVFVPLGLFVVVGLAAPWLTSGEPTATDLGASLEAPSWAHPLGTDQLGRDQLTRLLYAARTSLLATAGVLAITFSVGLVVGTVAGYAGGLVDRVVLRLIDLFQSVPGLIVALAILGLRGNGLGNLVLALSVPGWPTFARIARARVAGSRRAPHIEALAVLGARPRRILGRHLVPHALGPALVYASTDVGTIVLGVATLSFLGLGIAPPTPEWGQMLVDSRPFLGSNLWLALPPGIAITSLVLASNLISERLADPTGATRRTLRPTATPAGAIAAGAVRAEGRPGGHFYEVTGLRVAFASTDSDSGERPAVADVGYHIAAGRTLALVGESGSGKTLSALAPLGLVPGGARVTGSALLDGRELIGLDERRLSEVRGRRIGVVFQDAFAALNPVRTVGAQVDEAVRNAGTTDRRAARRRTVDLLGMVGLPDPVRLADDHPYRLSGGMRQRALIAIALAGEPDLLIADEPTSGLDVTIQAQLLTLLRRLRAELGMSMLFISHDLAVVNEIADTVAVMYAGRVVEHATSEEILHHPDHPYTQGLIDALPRLPAVAGARFRTMAGVALEHPDALAGCSFTPRCAWAEPRCGTSRPPLEPVGVSTNGAPRRSACWVHPDPPGVAAVDPVAVDPAAVDLAAVDLAAVERAEPDRAGPDPAAADRSEPAPQVR